jgi:queuine tRNA-ribosyltransferase
MQGMRNAIEESRFEDFYAKTKEDWARGDIPEL